MKASIVHYRIELEDTARTYEQLLDVHRAACNPRAVTAEPRSVFPREVTCSGCLDWIAKNYKTVVADLQERKAS